MDLIKEAPTLMSISRMKVQTNTWCIRRQAHLWYRMGSIRFQSQKRQNFAKKSLFWKPKLMKLIMIALKFSSSRWFKKTLLCWNVQFIWNLPFSTKLIVVAKSNQIMKRKCSN